MSCLTHLSLASLFWDIGKQNNPDVMPQNAVSHLGLFCLLNKNSSKNGIKLKISPNTPKNESGLIQLIMMGETIRQIWVKDTTQHQCSSNSDFEVRCTTTSQPLLKDFKREFFNPYMTNRLAHHYYLGESILIYRKFR